MKIFVIRHGQTELNAKNLITGHIDDVLTPKGINQAKNAVQFLPKTIKRIYSSSLKRAKQIAEIINQELKAPLTFHDELKEVNFGVLGGTPYLDEYKKRHRMLDYDWRPSGESFEDVKTRVAAFLKKLRMSIRAKKY